MLFSWALLLSAGQFGLRFFEGQVGLFFSRLKLGSFFLGSRVVFVRGQVGSGLFLGSGPSEDGRNPDPGN